MIGAASWPRTIPVEKDHASFKAATFPVFISSRPLKRVLAQLSTQLHTNAVQFVRRWSYQSAVRIFVSVHGKL